MGAGDVAGRPVAPAHDDLPQDALHDELARRRVYLHPIRWTSLGLSLLEAMHLGMPVVALATTEAAGGRPGGRRRASRRASTPLADGVRAFLAEPDRARARARRRGRRRSSASAWSASCRLGPAAGGGDAR